jgi:hypothetical protein
MPKGAVIGGIFIHEEVKSISCLQTDDGNIQHNGSHNSNSQHIAEHLQLLRDFTGKIKVTQAFKRRPEKRNTANRGHVIHIAPVCNPFMKSFIRGKGKTDMGVHSPAIHIAPVCNPFMKSFMRRQGKTDMGTNSPAIHVAPACGLIIQIAPACGHFRPPVCGLIINRAFQFQQHFRPPVCGLIRNQASQSQQHSRPPVCGLIINQAFQFQQRVSKQKLLKEIRLTV